MERGAFQACDRWNFSEHPPQPPTYPQDSRPHKACKTQAIAASYERNQSGIFSSVTCDQLSRNRDTDQAPKADNSIQTCVPPPEHLCPTKLPHTHGCQTDIRATAEAEHEGKNDQLRYTSGTIFRRAGQPKTEHGDHTECYGCDHRVEAAEAVGHVAGRPSTEEGADVEDREKLVGEGGVHIVKESVGGYIGDRYEEGEFDKEDSGCGQGEDRATEDAEVWPYVLANVYWRNVFFTLLGSIVRGQTCTYEQIGDAQ